MNNNKRIEDMNGIVLCAGLGTRLRPITHLIPKTVVPLGKYPLCCHNIFNLAEAGVKAIHCNTFHHAEAVEKEISLAVKTSDLDPSRIHFHREPERLETGGGIVNILKQMPPTPLPDALVVSGDVYGGTPLSAAATMWKERKKEEGSFAMMFNRVIPDLESCPYKPTWVDRESNRVVGFARFLDKGKWAEDSENLVPAVFNNIQFLSGEFLKDLLREETQFGSSVKLIYMRGLAEKRKLLNAFEPLQVPWFNVGSNPEYAACLKQLPDHLKAKLPTIKALAPSQAVHRELSTGFVYAGSVQQPLRTLLSVLGRLGGVKTDPDKDEDHVVDLLLSRRDTQTDQTTPLVSYSTPQHSTLPIVLGCPIPDDQLSYSLLIPFESLLTTDQSQTPEVHPVGSPSPSGAYALLYPQ